MKTVAFTQKGTSKTENEDRIVIGNTILTNGTFESRGPVTTIAIADGVGGNNAGAVASHYVVSRLALEEWASEEALERINDGLLALSMEKAEHSGMATTLSAMRIYNDHAEVFSIGNTRGYLIRSGKYLKQITSDDTTLNYLLAAGHISAEDAARFDRRNEITACFGGGSSSLFKIKKHSIEARAMQFMLTSDGIHDHVSIDQMEDIISECGATLDACRQLAFAARSNGSADDISIVLGEI